MTEWLNTTTTIKRKENQALLPERRASKNFVHTCKHFKFQSHYYDPVIQWVSFNLHQVNYFNYHEVLTKATMHDVHAHAQLCPTLCDPIDPIDCSPPGFSVYGIFQARMLEWVASFLLLGIFLTHGSSMRLWCLLHRQVDSSPLRYVGGPEEGRFMKYGIPVSHQSDDIK